MVKRDLQWKEWAENLRKWMMTNKVVEVSKTVEEIHREARTDQSLLTLTSSKFWNACRTGKSPVLPRAGFDVDFETSGDKTVAVVTFRLNETWQGIMERATLRQA